MAASDETGDPMIANTKLYSDMIDPGRLPEKCLLCDTGSLNRKGHILPKLVIRHLMKKGKLGGYFLDGLRGKKVQSTHAIRILCDKCEEFFGSYEKRFTERQFLPYYDNRDIQELDEHIYVFAVSIAWRIIVLSGLMRRHDELPRGLKEFEAIAKRFLELMRNAPAPTTSGDIDLYVLTAEEIERTIPAHAIAFRRLRYSIKQSAQAHDLYDARTGMPITSHPVPLVYFKLGAYYFFMPLAGYFTNAAFPMDFEPLGERGIFRPRDTARFLSFLNWIEGRADPTWIGPDGLGEIDGDALPSPLPGKDIHLERYFLTAA